MRVLDRFILIPAVVFLLVYYLVCWKGLALVGVPLTESAEALGKTGDFLLFLLWILPFFVIFFVIPLFREGSSEGDPIRLMLRFILKIFVAYVILLLVFFLSGGTALLGFWTFTGWLEDIGTFRFLFLYNLAAPAIAYIAALVVFVGLIVYTISTEERDEEYWMKTRTG